MRKVRLFGIRLISARESFYDVRPLSDKINLSLLYEETHHFTVCAFDGL